MLRYRITYGLLFTTLLLGVFYLDVRLAGNWPNLPWAAPPGSIVALAAVLLIPLALREMQGLLKRQNVTISMRICVVASLLCMTWPWISQIASETSRTEETLATRRATEPAATAWTQVAQRFETVKPHYLVPTVMAVSLVGAFVMHTRHHRIEGAMANAGGTLLAIVYLGLLPGFFLPICLTHGAWMVLGIVAIVKMADVGAYTTGRLIGRHKLIVWLSPGKTVEGFLGGLVAAGVTGMLVMALHRSSVTLPPGSVIYSMTAALVTGAILGVVLGAVGQLGDLMESLLKRDAGVKDSGHVPGFGGVLDLLDSPLLAAPAAYWMLKLLGRS
jgi:CDP-diglyceride synthetase